MFFLIFGNQISMFITQLLNDNYIIRSHTIQYILLLGQLNIKTGHHFSRPPTFYFNVFWVLLLY